MAKIKHLSRLHQVVETICPLISVDEHGNFDPTPEATDSQKAAARTTIAAFDDSDVAQAAWEEDRQPERKTLRQQAANAVADIDAFLALPTPTAAQVRDQVQDICRYLRGVIRRLVQID